MSTNGGITTESFPSQGNSARTLLHRGFKITTQKLPILKAGPIEQMTEKLGIAPPEMIFGDNYVALEQVATGWSITFDAFGALDLVDKTGRAMLQVAHSGEWQKSRCAYYRSLSGRRIKVLTSLQRAPSRGDQGGREALRLVLQHKLQGHDVT